MVSPDRVRRDLKDIRYYYARKAILDSVKGDVGINEQDAFFPHMHKRPEPLVGYKRKITCENGRRGASYWTKTYDRHWVYVPSAP